MYAHVCTCIGFSVAVVSHDVRTLVAAMNGAEARIIGTYSRQREGGS